jgi:hypothetical protein
MARHVEGPWYRKFTNGWSATLCGKAVPLGVKGRKNRGQAREV